MADQPTVGRIVHYRSFGTPGGEYTSECRAAVVTEVGGEVRTGPEGTVALAVLNPEGMFFNRHVYQDERDKTGGTWHWPERADPPGPVDPPDGGDTGNPDWDNPPEPPDHPDEPGQPGGDTTTSPPSPPPGARYPADIFGKLWKLTLPISKDGKVVEIRQPALATYSSKYCELTPDGKGVVFRAWHGGDTTQNSKNPRSELRETYGGDTEGYWDASKGRHSLRIVGQVNRLTKVKPHVVVGQLHNQADDVWVWRLEGSKLYLTNFNDTHAYLVDGNYQLGTRYTLEAVIESGVTSFSYNGIKLPYTAKVKGPQYFKAGNYVQSNPTTAPSESTSEYAEVVIYEVAVSHS